MVMVRPTFWARKSIVSLVLWPFSLLFMLLAFIRRSAFKFGILSSWRSPVPVVVVGNITVGGAGKTPLVIALCELLKDKGFNIGVVTRGYGGTADAPVIVNGNTDPALAGDEPVLIAKRTGSPIVVSRNRVAAVQHLIANHSVDCVLCDDGLQHYALKRDLEIAVVDAAYRFGNRFCLPAGPLRESVSRLATVDFSVFSGSDRTEAGYSLVGSQLVNIADESVTRTLESFAGKSVHAVAGIASPANFYNYLRSFGIDTKEHTFGDHAEFSQAEIDFGDDLPVVMTEKDMVRCRGFDLENIWYLPVSACLDKALADEIISAIEELIAKRKNNVI